MPKIEQGVQTDLYSTNSTNTFSQIPQTPNPNILLPHQTSVPPTFPISGWIPSPVPMTPMYYYPVTTEIFTTPRPNTSRHSAVTDILPQLEDSEELRVDKKRGWKRIQEKVEEFLKLIRSFNWTLGDMLYFTFGMTESNGQTFNPSPTHYHMVSRFLQGQTRITVSQILQIWLSSKYGLPVESHEERLMAYSIHITYLDIKHARPALTSFAAQIVMQKLDQEGHKIIKKEGGLHTFTPQRHKDQDTSLQHNLGPQTFSEISLLFEKKMPLSWKMLMSLAVSDGQVGSRKRRPPEVVSLNSKDYFQHFHLKIRL